MRAFLSLLLGSAAIVGFETTFGVDDWQPWRPSRPFDANVARPDAITFIRNNLFAAHMDMMQTTGIFPAGMGVDHIRAEMARPDGIIRVC